jgi:hypothetical protein
VLEIGTEFAQDHDLGRDEDLDLLRCTYTAEESRFRLEMTAGFPLGSILIRRLLIQQVEATRRPGVVRENRRVDQVAERNNEVGETLRSLLAREWANDVQLLFSEPGWGQDG